MGGLAAMARGRERVRGAQSKKTLLLTSEPRPAYQSLISPQSRPFRILSPSLQHAHHLLKEISGRELGGSTKDVRERRVSLVR